MKKKITFEDFLERAKKVQGDKFARYIYSEENFFGICKKVGIICKEHGLFWQRCYDHLNGCGCPKCAHVYPLTKEDIFEKVNKIHEDKYSIDDDIEFKNNKSKINVFCNNCNKTFSIRINDLFNGYGCPYCVGRHKTTEQYIEELKKKRKDFDDFDYSKVIYTKATDKITLIHKKCGHEFEQSASNHLNGVGCPYCATFPTVSQMEKKVADMLNDKGIHFEEHKRFDWLRYKSLLHLDFYLTDYNIGIEVQGEQHFVPIPAMGGDKNLIEQQERDKIKLNLCNEHGVKLFYITKKNFNISEIEKYIANNFQKN